MAQFYTLEEAARVLGMSPEDLKGKAQHREVRAFLDGGSWRFRVADVDELARRRGLGSDAELHLSDLDLPAGSGSGSGSGIKDVDLSEFQMGAARAEVGQPTGDFTASSGSGSDHDILLDDLSLPPNPVTGSSSVIIGMGHGGKLPSDSDVRLVPDNPKGASDSDVRVASAGSHFKAPSDSDVTLIADDTSQHEMISAAGSGDTAVRQSPVLGSSAEVPIQPDSDSDFELTPSSVIDALQPDSGSDFELSQAAWKGSDAESLRATPLRTRGDWDVTAADPGHSGINLSRPSDSGINLQMASGLGLGGADSIELSPLSAIGHQGRPALGPPLVPSPPAKPAEGQAGVASKPKSGPEVEPPSSATPLAGRVRKGDKDIFDDTDFEVDALGSDHDDKTMQLEAASDFELEESDTGSEVFAIDEDEVDQNAATAVGSVPALDEDEEGEDDGFDEATSGEMSAGAWDVESESSGAAAPGRAPQGTMLASSAPSAEWGGLWVGMLGVATVFMILLAFVSMDMVRNLYDLHEGGPASGLVKSLAGLIASG